MDEEKQKIAGWLFVFMLTQHNIQNGKNVTRALELMKVAKETVEELDKAGELGPLEKAFEACAVKQ